MAVNHIMQLWEFDSVHLLVNVCKLRQRAEFTKSFLMFSFGMQDLFFFFHVKNVGHEQMFIHPKHAANLWLKIQYNSLMVGRTQCQYCQVSGWQDMKAMPLSLRLPPSLPLSHFWHDNTSIQLGGLIMFHACAPALTAVRSHFTPFDTSLCHQ